MEDVNLWSDSEHATAYLEERRIHEARVRAYTMFEEWVPSAPSRVLDLGCGDGEVSARVRSMAPDAEVVAVDFSDEMLGRARTRFERDDHVDVRRHDLDDPLPEGWGPFDVVASAFAIHHLVDDRKRALYGEVFERLEPGGMFLNLEHVASATPELHEQFLGAIGLTLDEDDPSNKLVDVETQLAWLRDLGFTQVDCHFKWRELALLAGRRPLTRA